MVECENILLHVFKTKGNELVLFLQKNREINEQDKATLSYRTRLFSQQYIISRCYCYFVILLLEIRNIVFNFLIVQHGQPNKRG